jgi:protein LSM12
VVEGIVYTADPVTNLLVLNTSTTSSTSITSSSLAAPSGTYRIIPIASIASFQLLSLPPQTSEVVNNPALNTIDTNAVQGRLQKNIAAQQAAQARIGPKGTTPTDQALFDALSRTLTAAWSGNGMLISDTYLIEKPYGPVNVRIVDGRHGDLERMKKVVEMERQKVTLRFSKGMLDGKMSAESTPSKGATNAAIKKGG